MPPTDLLHTANPHLVLFLDVGGVLVHQKTCDLGSRERDPWRMLATIDPACAGQVVRIVRTTGCRIVLSSMIRCCAMQVTGLRRALINAGLSRIEVRRSGDVGLASTPHLEGNECRADEIGAWLREHPEVERYVVIDDHWVPDHVQAEPLPGYSEGGLLGVTADDAIRLLIDTVSVIQ